MDDFICRNRKEDFALSNNHYDWGYKDSAQEARSDLAYRKPPTSKQRDYDWGYDKAEPSESLPARQQQDGD